MNNKLEEIENISLKKKDKPVDFSKYVTKTFIRNFKNYLNKSETKEVSTILYDLEALDFNDVKEKINSGNFLADNKFGYNLLKTFIYSFEDESLKSGSKLNTYIDQLEASFNESNKGEKEKLIAIIYLALLNNLIQLMYGLAYYIVENEHRALQEQQRLNEIMQNKKSKAVAAQIAGGATFLFSDSNKLKTAGGAGLAYGIYKEYESKKIEGKGYNFLSSLREDLDRKYLNLLSYLVSGSQIASKLSDFKSSNEQLIALKDKILKKWTITCRFTFSSNEYKSFLLEKFLLSPDQLETIKEGVISKSNHIFDSTDLDKTDFIELYDRFNKIQDKKKNNSFKHYGAIISFFLGIILIPAILPAEIVGLTAFITLIAFLFLNIRVINDIKPSQASLFEVVFNGGNIPEYIYLNYDLKTLLDDYEKLLTKKRFYK